MGEGAPAGETTIRVRPVLVSIQAAR